MLAKNADLIKAFGTDNQVDVCKLILDKGEMQASVIIYDSTQATIPMGGCGMLAMTSPLGPEGAKARALIMSQ